MHTLVRSVSRLLLVVVLVSSMPATSLAQLISLKTVPIAAGDQFNLFPNRTMGMGGVMIALDDPLLDPFVNPGKGARIDGTSLFTTPALYSVTNDNGAGRSLPAGMMFGSNEWFGAAMLSLQEVQFAERGFGPIVFGREAFVPLSENSARNLYAFGMAGTKLRDSNVSIGGSIFWGGLDGLEGVDLLYAGSQRIEQSGHILDVRLGLLGQPGADRSYEVLVLYNQLDMTHEVTYWEPVFEPLPPDTSPDVGPIPMTRVETNLDRTNTFGVHLGYEQELAADGWRVGGILTTNYKEHPKIPNYEIMNIPRDPGNSWAFNFGVGVSRSAGLTTFGLDLILEPIWSDTWAEAAEPVLTASGRTIPAGWKTVENEFSFMNALLRMGLGVESERAGAQFGLQVYSIDYELDQTDHVQEVKRDQQESWLEWTPTWQLALKFPEIEVRYTGAVTMGTGQPGVAWTPVGMERTAAMDLAMGSDFVLAPSGPLTLQDASAWSHQFAVVIPVGSKGVANSE